MLAVLVPSVKVIGLVTPGVTSLSKPVAFPLKDILEPVTSIFPPLLAYRAYPSPE